LKETVAFVHAFVELVHTWLRDRERELLRAMGVEDTVEESAVAELGTHLEHHSKLLFVSLQLHR